MQKPLGLGPGARCNFEGTALPAAMMHCRSGPSLDELPCELLALVCEHSDLRAVRNLQLCSSSGCRAAAALSASAEQAIKARWLAAAVGSALDGLLAAAESGCELLQRSPLWPHDATAPGLDSTLRSAVSLAAERAGWSPSSPPARAMGGIALGAACMWFERSFRLGPTTLLTIHSRLHVQPLSRHYPCYIRDLHAFVPECGPSTLLFHGPPSGEPWFEACMAFTCSEPQAPGPRAAMQALYRAVQARWGFHQWSDTDWWLVSLT